MSKFSLLTSLTLDAAGFQSGISKATKSAQQFEKGIQTTGKMITNALSFAGVGLGLAGAFETVKKVIGATQFTADSFEQTMAGLKQTTDSFFIGISSGDWSVFTTGLVKSIASAKELANVLDNLGDVRRGLSIQAVELEGKQYELLEKMKDKTGKYSIKQQKEFYAEYTKNQENFNSKSLDAAYRERDAILKNYSDITGLEQVQIYQVLKNYGDSYEKRFADAGDKLAKAQTQWNQVHDITKEGAFYDGVNFKNYLNSLSEVDRFYVQLYKNFGKLNDAKLDTATESIKQVGTALNANSQFAVENIKLYNQLFKNESIPIPITAINAIPEENFNELYNQINDNIDEAFKQEPIKLNLNFSSDIDTSFMAKFKNALKADMESLNNIIRGGLEDMIYTLADGFGQMIAGAKDFKFGQAILSSLAGFMSSFGKAIIGIAVAQIALKNSFKNPYTALAAGIGLIALAGVIKGVVANQSANLNSAVGGGSTGTYYSYGDQGTGGMSTQTAVAGASTQTIQLRVSGTDLVSVINNTNKKYNKLV